jgi:hypothetical protein
MSAVPLKQHFTNPGLPGFVRFGGERLAQSGNLAGTVPVRPRSGGCSENFPAGKFLISELSDRCALATGGHPIYQETRKNFLQESFCCCRTSASLRGAELAYTGGRVMPTNE